MPLVSNMISDAFLKEIVIFALGAFVGASFKAWLDRGTYVSNKLFEERLATLNGLWLKFSEVKDILSQKIPLGYDNWRSRHYDEAGKALYELRIAIDKSQMILDFEIIAAFRSVHEYLFLSRDDKAQEPKAFRSELSCRISKLSDRINSTMAKRNHKISLRLST